MASNVDIVNRALAKIGNMRIVALSDPGKVGALAASIFNDVRDAETAAHAWNFAKARRRLPAEAEAPEFGWSYQYALPADCLRVLTAGPWPQPVMSDYINGDTQSWTQEGPRLLTNHGPALDLVYLKRVEEPGLMPAVFVEILACKLAVEMCEALNGSNSKRELAWKEYDMAVRQARRINAIGRPPQAVQDDSWMAAHLLGGL